MQRKTPHLRQAIERLFAPPSLLIIELGFHLRFDPSADYGFDVERTLPTRYWFGEKLRQLGRTLLTDLLAATVAVLKAEIPARLVS